MIVYDVENVTKVYPRSSSPANRNICLQISQGEIFGLLGDNGAGKTTLVRQMVGLLRPTSGEVRLLGRSASHDPMHVPTHVGYMPQEPRALTNLTVGEALLYTARLRGKSRIEAQRERDRLLALWRITDLQNRVTRKLSGGERRLLRLAVAMVADPPILILDEPTNDLAPQRRRQVWEVLGRMNRDHGTTILFITHDAIEAERAIQRVGIMRHGELVAVGTPSELKRQVDQELRLELFFHPDKPPRLPAGLTHRESRPGRWMVWIDRDEVSAVLARLDLESLEDFRLRSATLEDLYVHYTNSD